MYRCALILILLFASTAKAVDPYKLTLENYNRVHVGANIFFVGGCLGPATTCDFESATEKHYLWRLNGKTVKVYFENGKVTTKWQVGLD
jgi:hypothetical protein